MSPSAVPSASPSAPAPGAVLWLEQALAADPGRPCPPLLGHRRADVCIVGGGFVGLWTAIRLKEQAPELDVLLIDKDGCGYGASGRNGGWVTGWFDELDGLIEHFGADEAVYLADELSQAIGEIGDFAEAHGIDCSYRRHGALWTATAPAQLGAWDAAIAATEANGRGERLALVDGEELRRRTGSPLPLAGAIQTDAAVIQPALLVRGLRRVALELGVAIHEHTPMLRLVREEPARIETTDGSITADQVVLALGGWAGELRELRRAVVPVGSHIVATEPIPERLAELGWTGGEAFGDARLLVHYAQVSADGRIVFGRGGGAIGAAGRVLRRHFIDPSTVQTVAADFYRWFPSLADVRLTHAWGGAVDRAPGHLPWVGALGAGNIHYATGFSGNGVGPSALFGKMLAAVVLQTGSRLAANALISDPPGYLPPEPFRSLGGLVVRNAVRRAEATEERGAEPDAVTSALRRMVWFTLPDAVEPRRRFGRR